MTSPTKDTRKRQRGQKSRGKKVSLARKDGWNTLQQNHEELDTSSHGYMSLPRPWPHDSATPLCMTGTCDPSIVCSCPETSETARTPQLYLLDSQDNTQVRILTPYLGEPLQSLGHITTQPTVHYPFHSSSYPAGTALTTTERDEASGYVGTMYAQTPSQADLAVSHFELTPLQRFEAEPVSSQPYNTVSSIRVMSSGNNILPPSQPSQNIANNGSNIGGLDSWSFGI